jgi:hypothetical protein
VELAAHLLTHTSIPPYVFMSRRFFKSTDNTDNTDCPNTTFRSKLEDVSAVTVMDAVPDVTLCNLANIY